MALLECFSRWSGTPASFFAVDRAFIYAMTEALFGGDGSEPALEGKRRFSQIEKNVARAAMISAARALQASLSPVSNLTLNLERIETSLDPVSFDETESQAVVARLGFQALGRTGEMRVVIPRTAIRSARSKQDEATASTGAESEMARQMREEIHSTDIKLTAVLEERRMTLGELAG